MQYIIVGAGLTGCVIAQQLSENPENRILLVEKKKHIGGTCYDCFNEDGILIHKYGPHIFNTPDKKIWNYVNRFSGFLEYYHRVLGYVDGQLVPIPFNLKSIQLLFPKKMAESLCDKLLKKYGYNKKVPILELQKQKDEELQWLADYVYEKVFLHYTIKQWGQSPDEVGGKAMARIPVFVSTDDRYFQNQYQGIPEHGYTRMMENMLDAKNISILLGMDCRDVLKLEEADETILFDGRLYKGKVIYTACIDRLFEYRYGALPYRSLDFRFFTHDTESWQPVATVNYPCNYDFTRITEFKKLTFQKHPKTTIMKEYSLEYDPKDEAHDPLYPIPKEENETLYGKYLEEASRFSQLKLAGRLADYRYYTMAETIGNALNIAKELKKA